MFTVQFHSFKQGIISLLRHQQGGQINQINIQYTEQYNVIIIKIVYYNS